MASKVIKNIIKQNLGNATGAYAKAEIAELEYYQQYQLDYLRKLRTKQLAAGGGWITADDLCYKGKVTVNPGGSIHWAGRTMDMYEAARAMALYHMEPKWQQAMRFA